MDDIISELVSSFVKLIFTVGIGVLLTGFVELVFIVVGIYAIVATLSDRAWGIKSKSWFTVEGNITSTQIDETEDKYSESGPKTLYYPVIDYSYAVGGIEYVSNRVSFEDVRSYTDRIEAEKWLSRYPN